MFKNSIIDFINQEISAERERSITSAHKKKPLENVQEKAVKMVASLKNKDYKERCAEQDIALVHKLIKDSHGEDMFEFRANNDGARTRQAAIAYKLTVQYAQTDLRKYSFAVRVVEPWNQLTDSVKQAAHSRQGCI